MHALARHLHGGSAGTDETRNAQTRGRIINMGWAYDQLTGVTDALLFRGQLRSMWRRAIAVAAIQPGERALDVGCGTGALALEVQRLVGPAGRVVGIDPGGRQIARARSKAARRHVPTEFTVGVVESLPFPDQTFDAAFSTLMMHHLPKSLKQQGLSEIARVLKPGGRLIIADFVHVSQRQGRAKHFHAGGTDTHELSRLLDEAGFSVVEARQMPPKRFSAFPGAGLLVARRAPHAAAGSAHPLDGD